MHVLQRILWSILIVSIPALSARAGPNGGGTLMLHDASLSYTSDDVCGIGIPPGSCETADTRIDGAWPGAPKVWEVYAAFVDGSRPRLKALAFGIDYDSSKIKLVSYGDCTGEPPHPVPPPLGPHSGVEVVFQDAQTSLLVECFWFAGYVESPAVFRLIDHPSFPAEFADDSVPALLDRVVGLGAIGFDMDGEVICPDAAREGACCDLKQGTCAVRTVVECDTMRYGSFDGSASCEPNPCPTSGPCCLVESGACVVETPDECRNQGNLFAGLAGQTCEDYPGNQCGSATLGACCDGQSCTVTFLADCVAPAIWVARHPCYPGGQNPCLQPWGACCVGDQCTIETTETCADPVRFYPGVRCDPGGGPCVVAVEQVTWGVVKRVYH